MYNCTALPLRVAYKQGFWNKFQNKNDHQQLLNNDKYIHSKIRKNRKKILKVLIR
jgi:hypothetical protein